MNDQAAAQTDFDGRMLLFQQPELLSVEAHGGLGLTPPAEPYAFAAGTRAVPLVVSEVVAAQRHYPVIFSGNKDATLLAIVGTADGENLFVDAQGHWDPAAYVPSYLRCHPFAFARGENDQLAVVIDRAAPSISDSPAQPFFDGDQLSEATRARVEFCGNFEAEQRATREFCQRVQALGLFAGQRASYQAPGGEETLIADYVTVNARKLKELDAATVAELNADGTLAMLHAQLFSQENWNTLVVRKNRRDAAQGA